MVEQLSFVNECLNRLGLSNYIQQFAEHEIDKDTFLLLTKEEIQSLLPGKMGPQKKLLAELERIRGLDKKKPQQVVNNSPIASPNKPSQQLQVPQKVPISPPGNKNTPQIQNGVPLRRKNLQNGANSNLNVPAGGRSPSPHRKTSVLQVENTPNPKPPAGATSTGTNVATTIAPIAITILVGCARQEIIKNYTAPALNDLLDNKDTLPTLPVASGNVENILPGSTRMPNSEDRVDATGNTDTTTVQEEQQDQIQPYEEEEENLIENDEEDGGVEQDAEEDQDDFEQGDDEGYENDEFDEDNNFFEEEEVDLESSLVDCDVDVEGMVDSVVNAFLDLF